MKNGSTNGLVLFHMGKTIVFFNDDFPLLRPVIAGLTKANTVVSQISIHLNPSQKKMTAKNKTTHRKISNTWKPNCLK